MKLTFEKTVVLVAFFLMLSVAFAQPGKNRRGYSNHKPEYGKAKEKIEALKIEKLIEILALSDKEAEKFENSYKEAENEIKQMRLSLDQAEIELQKQLLSEDDKLIKKSSDDFLARMNDMHSAIANKHNKMRTLLNEKQYAKYLLFEMGFTKKLQSAIMERRNQD